MTVLPPVRLPINPAGLKRRHRMDGITALLLILTGLPVKEIVKNHKVYLKHIRKGKGLYSGLLK
jgi:hypothetical protein